MNKEFDINKIVSDMDFSSNMLLDIGNGIMLTNREVEVLNKCGIDYKNCISLKEILYKIEDAIENEKYDVEELDYISSTIAERDYYQNTNK